MQLNGSIQLKQGEKVKIKIDLTSNSPEAIKKRKFYAAQLFPRLSVNQQNAFHERQQKVSDYLEGYETLSNSTMKGEPLIQQIKSYLARPESSLDSIRKKYYMDRLNFVERSLLENKDILENNELILLLNKIKKELCEEVQPTYFNLMKAIYPLLADTYELAKRVCDENENPGELIGMESLETQIKKALTDPKHSEETKQLAKNLEKRISEVKDPAFFAYV